MRIENGSDEAVQLLSRSWTIVDGRGTVHEVIGEGVVGEMPLIAPGASFDYVSGCPLDTPERGDERQLSHGRRGRKRVRRGNSALPIAQRLILELMEGHRTKCGGPLGPVVALSSNDGWNIVNYRSRFDPRSCKPPAIASSVLAPEDDHADAIARAGRRFSAGRR